MQLWIHMFISPLPSSLRPGPSILPMVSQCLASGNSNWHSLGTNRPGHTVLKTTLHQRMCSVTQCVQLFETPCNLPDSCVHGISQVKILGWVVLSFPRGSSGPKDHTGVSSSPALAGGSFTTQPPGKPLCHLMSTYLIGARHPEQWGNTGVHHT